MTLARIHDGLCVCVVRTMVGTRPLMRTAPTITTAIVAATTPHPKRTPGTRAAISATNAAKSPTYDQHMRVAWRRIQVSRGRRNTWNQPAKDRGQTDDGRDMKRAETAVQVINQQRCSVQRNHRERVALPQPPVNQGALAAQEHQEAEKQRRESEQRVDQPHPVEAWDPEHRHLRRPAGLYDRLGSNVRPSDESS